jgi:DNA processing protein
VTASIARGEAGYPPRLEELTEPPPALYLRAPADGQRLAELTASPCVAIVGARMSSAAGSAFARRMASGLARADVAVLSGLAAGIDGAAHAGALDAGGRTLAVLGCGIDRDYPRSNAALAARIAVAGAVVSEYPPGIAPAPWRFPARNRIVAALADLTVVVEASRTSGALITAGFALELGREVLAVPASPWVDAAAGGNALLRDGATPVTCAEDVLVALGIDPSRASGPPALALQGDPGRLLAAIRRGPGTPESLAARLGFDAGRVGRAIAALELAGAIVRERDGSLVGV